ncbi:MAG: hypothetical protein ACXAAI_14470 [Promethearchaeota archaeon]|jgi:hypothetical protein
MEEAEQEEFIEKVLNIIDRWSFEHCAYCEEGALVSIEGMLDFKCAKCGKSMNPVSYLGEIAKIVFSYRDKMENP